MGQNSGLGRPPEALSDFDLGSASCSSCHLLLPCAPLSNQASMSGSPSGLLRFSSECASPPAQQSPSCCYRKGLAVRGKDPEQVIID